MKIDVEGMEFQVILGAIKTIVRDKPNLMIEINEPEVLEFLVGI
jgi:FkbM family methyltransferase